MFARAGLTDGSLQVLAAASTVKNDIDWRAKYGKGVAGNVKLAGIDWRKPGAHQNADARASGVSLTRIEHGHWDPRRPTDYCFITTTSAPDGGIIDTKDLLGAGTFLFDAQVHGAHPDPDVVEHGQLLRLEVGDWAAVYEGGQPTRP